MKQSLASLLRFSRTRLVLLVVVALYIAVFNMTYRSIVVPIFGAWGYGSSPIPFGYLVATIALCLIPALWMPIKFSRPSLLLFYFQYFLTFIPASFIVFTSTRPELPHRDAFVLVLAMFAGLSLIQASYVVAVRPIRAVRLSPQAFWFFLAAAGTMMFLYLAVKLGGSFRLVGFQDIYALRYENAETLAATGTRFGLYSESLLSALVLPLVFATGVASRRFWVIVPVALGYVFLFGVGAAKAMALAVLYLPLAAILLSRPPRRIPGYFVLGLTIALAFGYVTQLLLPPDISLKYTAVVHFRLVAVPALTLPQYFQFFQSHPVTHLAHVTGFNWLLPYPYDMDVPYTIGAYFYGAFVGVNSGLWAGDGITGFGIWGIPVVSVICALVFWLLDSASAEFEPAFVALGLTFCTVFFDNVSLFTTLITGGLALVMIAMLVAPRDPRGHIRVPTLANLRRITRAETV